MTDHYQPPFYVASDGNGHFLGVITCICKPGHIGEDRHCPYCCLEDPYDPYDPFMRELRACLNEQANPEHMSTEERIRSPKGAA